MSVEPKVTRVRGVFVGVSVGVDCDNLRQAAPTGAALLDGASLTWCVSWVASAISVGFFMAVHLLHSPFKGLHTFSHFILS